MINWWELIWNSQLFFNKRFTCISRLNNVCSNEYSELDFWDGKAPGWTLAYGKRLPLGPYVGKELGLFVCSIDVTSYCNLGVLSIRDLLRSIALPEADWNY